MGGGVGWSRIVGWVLKSVERIYSTNGIIEATIKGNFIANNLAKWKSSNNLNVQSFYVFEQEISSWRELAGESEEAI